MRPSFDVCRILPAMSFPAATCHDRRQGLRTALKGGAILLPAALLQGRNYPHNYWPFRQDSTFLYYTGLTLPGGVLVIAEDGSTTLYADPVSLDDLVWTGPVPSPAELAAGAGISRTAPLDDLPAALRALDATHVAVHYLAPWRPEIRDRLAAWLGLTASQVMERASLPLRDAVIQQRLIKSAGELAEIEKALAVTARMHALVAEHAQPGVTESSLAARITALAAREGCPQAYHPIVTVRGEVLHNHDYPNTLAAGDLLLCDAGAEAPSGYASDVTRTWPVGGTFTDQQRALYTLVRDTQAAVIAAIRPGKTYRELHDLASVRFAEGLIALGLMQGEPQAAVAVGAHAAFFVHGLGHALGLDVHDMEDLGEDAVGYAPGQQRSDQFGTAFLRYARPLEVGHVVTVEPGLYCIPTLWDQWAAAGRHREFIRYDQLAAWRSLGGIRIEDDIVVTESGCRVLGPGIGMA